MPILQRPDGEIYYEEFGQGFPILLFAPGGLRSRLLPGVEVVTNWRGPDHLAEQYRRVRAFLDRHTPQQDGGRQQA